MHHENSPDHQQFPECLGLTSCKSAPHNTSDLNYDDVEPGARVIVAHTASCVVLPLPTRPYISGHGLVITNGGNRVLTRQLDRLEENKLQGDEPIFLCCAIPVLYVVTLQWHQIRLPKGPDVHRD